jgi:hypothetical protein
LALRVLRELLEQWKEFLVEELVQLLGAAKAGHDCSPAYIDQTGGPGGGVVVIAWHCRRHRPRTINGHFDAECGKDARLIVHTIAPVWRMLAQVLKEAMNGHPLGMSVCANHIGHT